MTDRPTVHEIIVTAALSVAVPIENGDELRDGLATVLGDIDGVRHVNLEELGDVERENNRLGVETYTRITFHFNPDEVDVPEQAARDGLGTAETISSVQNFEIASGPYLIESW